MSAELLPIFLLVFIGSLVGLFFLSKRLLTEVFRSLWWRGPKQ